MTTTTKTAARHLPIGQRIVWARKRKGISQERLALLARISRRHLVRIEGGDVTRPTPRILGAIADATGQPESFFEDDEEEDSGMTLDQLLTLRVKRIVAEAGVPAHASEGAHA